MRRGDMRIRSGVNGERSTRADRSVAPRAAWTLTLVSLINLLAAGCIPPVMSTTTRMALAPSPGMPPTIDGSTGLGLTARALPVLPQTMKDKGAVAFPYIHPELSGVVKVGEHLLFSARLAGASAGLPLHHPGRGPRLAADAVGVEGVIGAAAQFKFSRYFGGNVAGEAGIMLPAVTSDDSAFGLSTRTEALPAIRFATSVFFEYGPLRIFALFVAGDFVGNDFTSVRTTNCNMTPCSVSDTGTTSEMGMLGVGGGLRVRIFDMVAVGAEAFTSTGEGTVFPLSISATVRVGKFEIPIEKRKPRVKKEPELTPPPMIIPGDAPAEIPPPML